MKQEKIVYPSDLPPYENFKKWIGHVLAMVVFVYYTRGLIALIQRVVLYVNENVDILLLIFFKSNKNVLYISGCPGGSRYYRCKNQSELLSSHGITSSIYSQHSLNLFYLVNKFDVFIFQRVVFNKYINRLIQLIKDKKKKIIFETDDLVFDPVYLSHMDYYFHMEKVEKLWYENGIGREMLEDKGVKYCVVSTDYLAKAIKKKYPDKEIFISYNKMGREQVLLAEKTLAKIDQIKVNDGKIRIGYFSGSNSHNKDFNAISDVLIKVLKENPNIVLMIVGYLNLDKKFLDVKNQIECIPFVPVYKLTEIILRADINIAPLEINNPFCQAKSGLKYFEAGILGVPTIASSIQDFARCIHNGENGFVAEKEADWEEFLTRLIQDNYLREKIGKQAREDSLENHVANKKIHGNRYLEFIQRSINDFKSEFT